jgi:fucose permease
MIGVLEGAAGSLWPDVIDAFDVSKGAFGATSGIGFIVAFPVLIFGGRLTQWLDKRALMGMACGLMAFAGLGISLGHGFFGLAMLLAVRGIGICLLDLSANALTMELEQQSGRHLMSPLHSGFSGGIIFGAGVAWLIFALDGSFRSVYLLMTAVLILFAAAAFAEQARHPFPKRRVRVAGSSELSLALYRRADIRAIALFVGVAFSGEVLIAQWIGIYLRDELGYSASAGVRAVLTLGGAMFLGRLANAAVAGRLGARRSLLLQGIVLAVGGLLVVASESALVTTIGCGIVGLGIAGVAPTALSLAGAAVRSSPGAASGAALIAGYLGGITVPFAAGGLASIASVRAALAGEIALGLLVAAVAALLTRWLPASR